jgi:benzoyl-CoA reductase/2-hydroxyglutaryl-CoA dehydratase subunit BcrC/BadD/HgdB
LRKKSESEGILMNVSLPEQFENFSEARRQGFLRVKNIKDQGGLIAGIFCTFTPLEVLDAAGIIPVSLCGMSNETVADAEAVLPKNLCPLIKSSYGFAVSGKCPYTYFSDLIVGETTCDGKKKMYELLGRLKKTFILHLPQGADYDYSLSMWISELRRFMAYLQETFHAEISEDKLREAARKRNEERQLRCELMRLQQLTPPPMTGYQLYKTLEGAGFKFYHEEIMASLRQLRDSVEQSYAQGARPVAAGAKRILITGCPIGGVLDKTVKILEEKGGAVVCFENCSGYKAAYQLVDADAPDIVASIARRYLEIGCAVMTPNTKRMELLPKLAKEFQADGIVEVLLQSCQPYSVESAEVRELSEKLGLPYLSVETDYSSTDLGQLSTRLEAFLELL